MISVGSFIINIGVDRWFFCVCVGCDAPFTIPVDPRIVESYRCPRCMARIDRPPRHYTVGMLPPDAKPIRLGDGLFIGLPARFEDELNGRHDG